MEKTIRLADVAEAAGVSRGTASNVFNQPHLVREEVRKKVHEVAKSLGYRGPDPKGRLLRAGKVNAIGVATAEPLSYFFSDPFAREMMTGISEACDANGAGISLVSAMNDEKLAWNIQSAIVDGFILFCIEGGPRLVELTRERQLPFVALELGIKDETISAVGVDNREGARLAARHMAELGHRRYAVLAMPFVDDRHGPVTPTQIEAGIYSDTRDRVRGYFAELASFGIDTSTIPVFETQNDEASVIAGMEHIFGSAAEPPTALLAMSDRMALTAMEWLRQHGLKVPEDVSVIGFDGVPEGAMSNPPLTTIAQPIAEIGRIAVQMILNPDSTAQRRTLGVELVVRKSTAAAPR